jgi:hypothetical protein
MRGAGVDLVTYLRSRCEDPSYKCVVLAHPCSGTTWLVDVLNALGISALHELVRPQDPAWRVLVTYRTFGWSGPEEHLHLVRDPLRVVRSCAALFEKRPRVAKDIFAQIVGDGVTATVPKLGDLGPVSIAAWTLAVFNQRAEALVGADGRFRIEDVAAPANVWVPIDTPLDPAKVAPRRNSHARGEPLEWDDIKMCRDPLWTQFRRYGYPVAKGE